MAQLGARLDGIEEVVGSNPIGSTNFFIVQKTANCYQLLGCQICFFLLHYTFIRTHQCR